MYVLLNCYSSMKKMRKIRMVFDIENWLWKSYFCTFWQFAVNLAQISIIFFGYVDSLAKIFLILHPVWKLHNLYRHKQQQSAHLGRDLIQWNVTSKSSILLAPLPTKDLFQFSLDHLLLLLCHTVVLLSHYTFERTFYRF